MDVSISRKMIAVASSDMAINIFHMETFSVISNCVVANEF